MIEKLYKESNYINKIKAISNNTCHRCLSKNLYKDDYGIIHCLDCYNYHKIDSTMFLYRYINTKQRKTHILKLEYELNNNQVKGSNFFVDCLKNKTYGFLQAVCGAGKTEITLNVVLEALNKFYTICFVTPRVEVLKEVANRYKSHFPKTCIKTLYAENKDYHNADIIFSTPQQLINFYQEFDLIILDEVDAFPYLNNIKLERLVKKSLKKTGIILYMSATIDETLAKKIQEEGIKFYTIVSRYHLINLPVPKLLRINNLLHLNTIIIKILKEKIELDKSVIVFVPTIKYGDSLKDLLYKNNIFSKTISSKTVYKKQLIKAFKRKEFQVLISTTILERGVTFKDIDCIVCSAEHRVFSKESLIQISGRVNRVKDFQNGEAIFIYEHISKPIKKCIKEIKLMNRLNQSEM
ncbi:DEAD/DEAH box helicase family protein [Candidatus Izemoplasma sp. B36]|uniref:DEAD/DEAH box helicase family protein n=1 Tax=Candidatus Izemoplasma sp. B36 TaxID=3242468 RepID=UPI003556A5F1